MEWVLKLEARNGWSEVETIEVGRLERRVVGLTAEELGLTPAESKTMLGEPRTRKIQTLFGTVTVDAPRISICPCRGGPAVPKYEDAAEVQFSLRSSPKPLQSGTPSRRPTGLQAETVDRIGRVAGPRGIG